MKKKILKKILIIIGLLPLIYLLVVGTYKIIKYGDYYDPFTVYFECVYTNPIILLGFIPLFVGLCLNSKITKYFKTIWIIVLVISSLLTLFPAIVSIPAIFNGFTLNILGDNKAYGFEGFFNSMIIYLFVFWPITLIGLIFVII